MFKTSFHNRVKAHNTKTIDIKCSLPKQLRNGNFVAKLCRPFSNYLPLNFMLQFKKGKSYLKIANPSSKGLTIKAGTTLGSVSFKLIQDLSQCVNTTTHLHQVLDGSSAMCSLRISVCPINHYYSYNQNKMSPAQIRELKVRTFPYLSVDDVRLSMSDRNIIRKKLHLDTDSVLSGNDKQYIRDFLYSMRKCL